MIQTITIAVKSAALVFGMGAAPGAVNTQTAVPYCTVEVTGQPGYELYEDPEGGCKGLGKRLLQSFQGAYPDKPVLLIVDGESDQGI